MKKFIVICILLNAVERGSAQTFQLLSPDSSLRLELNAASKLSYRLFASSAQLVSSSSIDLQLVDGRKRSDKIAVSKKQFSRIRETVVMQVPYRSKQLADNYNLLKLSLKQPFD